MRSRARSPRGHCTLEDQKDDLRNWSAQLLDVHQSTALRAVRKVLARWGGEVHSETRAPRRRGLSWSSSSSRSDQVLVLAPTWACAAAGLVAAVATHPAVLRSRPREGVEL